MADNSTLPATGESIRDIDRAGVKTQVVALDGGGAAWAYDFVGCHQFSAIRWRRVSDD